ncbi:hypothetical protein PoB_007542700 [Plakobranchus ocellatus]|uniref:Uncharacterized protein n=1 Tax=Plakobranchus ocellatus TaxID=259542 RepID=A0AAV4DY22_9GAST|nr:hypothetical protein PoB_007542700 [Plakobranchus ocellatus]
MLRGVGGTVANESSLRSAGTLLSRLRAPLPAPWPDGGPESLRSSCFHNKVISGFRALRQARAPVAGLEPATEGSLQISGRTRKPLCYRRPPWTEDDLEQKEALKPQIKGGWLFTRRSTPSP